MWHSIFVLLPTRARTSLDDRHRITAFLEQGGPANEIERGVREHKFTTSGAFRHWSIESRNALGDRDDGFEASVFPVSE